MASGLCVFGVKVFLVVMVVVCSVVGDKKCYSCFHHRHDVMESTYNFEMRFKRMQDFVSGMGSAGGEMAENPYCTPNMTFSINGKVMEYMPNNVKQLTCSDEWYCVKEYVELDYKNYFVTRSCRAECGEQWRRMTDGTLLVKKCCQTNLCNNAHYVIASRWTILAQTIVAAILGQAAMFSITCLRMT